MELRKQIKRMNSKRYSNILSLFYTISNLALVTSALQFTNETTFTTGGGSGITSVESETGEGGLVFTNPSNIKPNTDPENTLDIVQKARNNEFSAEMLTNKTRAMISCETGEILVRLNFTEPFRGVGYADYDRSSPCKFFGDGGQYYEMRLPLKGCGTKQEAPRLFINNIILRFHRSLELEEDEAKTIVCRYPPPQAPAPPPPPGLPAKVIQVPPEPAKLTQYEPFVIIAGLLFFALLLAGIGTTSYVTKKQVLKPINTPLPITSTTEYDTYIDNQSIITVEDIETNMKIVPLPKLTTQVVDDVFITNIHEIETIEDLVHHKHVIPKPHLERHELEDVYITNEEEIMNEEILRQQQLARERQLNRLDCDDAYITNQDEITEEKQLTQQKMLKQKPKIEIRTIEDTFITNVDEIEKRENTTHLKNHEQSSSSRHHLEESYETEERYLEGQQYQHQDDRDRLEYREGYRDC